MIVIIILRQFSLLLLLFVCIQCIRTTFTMTIARTKISDIPVISEAQLIYESPDGGKTIYAREIGTDVKFLVKRDPYVIERQRIAKRANRLLAILKVAETDITLNDALEQLEALYLLKYGHESNEKDY